VGVYGAAMLDNQSAVGHPSPTPPLRGGALLHCGADLCVQPELMLIDGLLLLPGNSQSPLVLSLSKHARQGQPSTVVLAPSTNLARVLRQAQHERGLGIWGWQYRASWAELSFSSKPVASLRGASTRPLHPAAQRQESNR